MQLNITRLHRGQLAHPGWTASTVLAVAELTWSRLVKFMHAVEVAACSTPCDMKTLLHVRGLLAHPSLSQIYTDADELADDRGDGWLLAQSAQSANVCLLSQEMTSKYVVRAFFFAQLIGCFLKSAVAVEVAACSTPSDQAKIATRPGAACSPEVAQKY